MVNPKMSDDKGSNLEQASGANHKVMGIEGQECKQVQVMNRTPPKSLKLRCVTDSDVHEVDMPDDEVRSMIAEVHSLEINKLSNVLAHDSNVSSLAVDNDNGSGDRGDLSQFLSGIDWN